MPSEDGAAPAAAAVAGAPPPEILLDGRLWQSRADFFAAFFPAVQAPDWHGHNLDALNDSVCNGGINGLDNYTLVIRAPAGGQWPNEAMSDFMGIVKQIFDRAEAEGQEEEEAEASGKRALRIVFDEQQ